jgi:hypothetical protein
MSRISLITGISYLDSRSVISTGESPVVDPEGLYTVRYFKMLKIKCHYVNSYEDRVINEETRVINVSECYSKTDGKIGFKFKLYRYPPRFSEFGDFFQKKRNQRYFY